MNVRNYGAFPGVVLIYLALQVQCRSQPDPMVLLQGVESVREQIPPSRLLIRAVYSNSIRRNEHDFWVLFSRERRHFTRTNAPQARMLFNGSDVIAFDGHGSVVIRNLDTSTADYLFDPRLIGLSAAYGWSETIRTALPYRDALRIELIGRELCRDIQTWRVQVIDARQRKLNIWIDDRDFRVYRWEEAMSGAGHRFTVAYYESSDYPWLPTRAETESYNSAGTLLHRRSVSIVSAKGKVRIPEATWTLAGLRVPPKVPINDVRMMKRVGYWDGKRIVPEFPVEKPGRPPWTAKRVLALSVVVGVFLLPIAALAFRRRREKSKWGNAIAGGQKL